MIINVYASNLHRHPGLADQMFRMRARVFKDRLRWDVIVENGVERDEYDDMDPLYVMSIDDRSGLLRGSVRILPTTGRHMMGDIFNDFFDEPVLAQSPQIWECTRFAIHPDFEATLTPTGLNVATSELLLGVCDAARASGVTQILGVSEVPMLRIYRRSGWAPEIVGRSTRPGTVAIFAGLWDVTREASLSIRARAGFAADLPATEAMAA
jgi:N-acyl-L-homoserine lactone synthetase